MKIQTKIFLAFSSILAILLAFSVVMATYNQSIIYKSIDRGETIRKELKSVTKLSTLGYGALITIKKYVRTGKPVYHDDFIKKSDAVQGLINDMAAARYPTVNEPEKKKAVAEEILLATISRAWAEIRGLSAKIFEFERPAVNMEAAAVAEEMGKIWKEAVTGAIKKWHNIEMDELDRNAVSAKGAWQNAWKIMAIAVLLFVSLGLYLSHLLAGFITAPIRSMKRQVEDITRCRLSGPIEVRQGDELEGLAKAFNAMRRSLGETCDKLERSADRYRRLIYTAPDAVFLLAPPARSIVEANDAAAFLTGYSREALLRLSIDSIHPTCFEGDCGAVFSILTCGDREERQNAFIKKKSGELVPVDITASRVETNDGEFVLCFMRDISERAALEKVREEYTIELEQKVKERTSALELSIIDLENSKKAVLELLDDVEISKKEWEDTFDSIPDPIFIHDDGFRVIKCNRAYQKLSGRPFQDIIRRPYYEVYPLMKGPFAICAKEKEGYCRVEEEEITLGEDSTFRLRYIPLRDNSGAFTYSLHLMEDISEEKKNLMRIEQEVSVNRQLLKIAEATSKTTNIDILLKEIVSCVKEILSADIVAAYLGDEETKSFIPSQGAGIDRISQAIFKNSHIDGKSHIIIRALERGEVTLIPADNRSELHQVFHGNRFIESLEGLASIALIPITYRGMYLGIIIAAYRESNIKARKLKKRDLDLMRGFASQASVAIDEARLYKESINRTMDLSRKILTIKMLNEIDRSILSSVSTDEILETSARMISHLVQCDGADVWVLKDERIVYTTGYGRTLAVRGESFDIGKTIFSRVINDSMPFTSSDTREITIPEGIEKNFKSKGLNSVIIIPLMVKDEIKGMLNVSSRRVSAFSSEDLSTLEHFSAHIGVALENARLISDLEGLFLGTVRTLSKTIDAKSPWTRGHSERVTEISIRIARVIGFSNEELRDLELAGLLHDIGKIATYEGILDKAGRLTSSEYKQIQEHPVKGADILSPLKELKDIIPGVKYHHVWYDGGGYPNEGISGKALPAFARILAVADTIDAMSADRPYRKGKSIEEVVAELKRCSGTQFDPDVVSAFLSTIR